MPRGVNSYEVQVYQTDHWVLDTLFDDEASARAYAKKALAGGRIEGVRIVRDYARPDGRHVETEIHSEFRAVSNALTIAPIDEPPPVCHSAQDVYGVEARVVMNRLLRGYVDRMVVTPTEILHNYGELKRLMDKDNLLPMAVGRVAALQAEKIGMDGRARRDELYELVNGVSDRARAASQRKDLPEINVAGFRPVFEMLDATEAPEDRDFLARAVVSRDLVQMRNWFAKLDYLSELTREDGGIEGEPLGLVDGMMADVFGAPSVAQELLGHQNSLGEALCNLVDLSRGRLDAHGRPHDDRAVQLSELLAFFDLHQTRFVILDFVRRQVRGTQPLYRADPGAEKDAFHNLLMSVTSPNGVVGGGPMAEALVQRYLRFLEAGGATGRRQAMGEVISRYGDAKDRIRFLIAFAESDLGRQHHRDIGALFDQMTGDITAFSHFVDRTKPIKDNLEELTRLYLQVTDSSLPSDLKTPLADNIDELLTAYIVQSRVVERLDNPDDILRHRANRLMQLCAPGTLRSRKALNIVRQRVVNHLKQPNFERRYIEDLTDPAMQQRALREFYKLLGQAGLS